MSNGHFDVDAMREDVELERMLTSLGPTVMQQERVEIEGPTPAFSESLRRRVAGKPKGARSRSRRFAWTGVLGGVAVVAIAVVLALFLRGGTTTSTHRTAFSLPTPGRSDLSKSYPLEGGRGGGGGPPRATHSSIDLLGGDVYA